MSSADTNAAQTKPDAQIEAAKRSDRPVVKMIVSCHKPFSCPANEHFMPVQVGAKNAARAVPGAVGDDTGDNISDRNPTFSEMTAQYWVWKNFESDYVGQCHYRRYFYFGSNKYTANDHAQIEVESLCPRTHREFALDDSNLLLDIVERYDMVTPNTWDVRFVDTPLGPQSSVGKHMMGYNLIDEASLNLLLQIVDERHPEYSEAVRSYLDGHAYAGYNCFVMRRDLFEELCRFEFDVLLEFDRRFDYTHRTQNQARVCGYMGEILVSAFENQTRNRPDVKSASFPLTFFENTDPVRSLEEATASESRPEDGGVDVVWRPSLFYNVEEEDGEEVEEYAAVPVATDSLALSMGERLGSLTVLLPDCSHETSIKGFLGSEAKQATLALLNEETLDCSQLGSRVSELVGSCPAVFLPLFLPWLMPKSRHILWADGDVLACDDAERLIDALGDAHIACTPIYNWSCLLTKNDAGRIHNLARHLGIDDAYTLASPDVQLINAEAVREATSPDGILAALDKIRSSLDGHGHLLAAPSKDGSGDALLDEHVILWNAILTETGVTTVDSLPVLDAMDKTWALTAMPRELYARWKESAADPCLVIYRGDALPMHNPAATGAIHFWKQAHISAAYELLIAEMSAAVSKKPSPKRRVIDWVLPPYSKRRSAIKLLTRKLRSMLHRGATPTNQDIAQTLHHAND